jgi:hypothetical protein
MVLVYSPSAGGGGATIADVRTALGVSEGDVIVTDSNIDVELPDTYKINFTPVINVAALIALSATSQAGDYFIVTDSGDRYVRNLNTNGDITDFTLLEKSGSVSMVNIHSNFGLRVIDADYLTDNGTTPVAGNIPWIFSGKWVKWAVGANTYYRCAWYSHDSFDFVSSILFYDSANDDIPTNYGATISTIDLVNDQGATVITPGTPWIYTDHLWVKYNDGSDHYFYQEEDGTISQEFTGFSYVESAPLYLKEYCEEFGYEFPDTLFIDNSNGSDANSHKLMAAFWVVLPYLKKDLVVFNSRNTCNILNVNNNYGLSGALNTTVFESSDHPYIHIPKHGYVQFFSMGKDDSGNNNNNNSNVDLIGLCVCTDYAKPAVGDVLKTVLYKNNYVLGYENVSKEEIIGLTETDAPKFAGLTVVDEAGDEFVRIGVLEEDIPLLANVSGQRVQIIGNGTHRNIVFARIQDGANPTTMYFAKGRGTLDAQTVVANNDSVMAIRGYAYDGEKYLECGMIQIIVDDDAALDTMSGRLVFYTKSGADSLLERARINSAGNFLVGTSIDNGTGAKIQVAGDISVTGKLLTQASPTDNGTGAKIQTDVISMTGYREKITTTTTTTGAATIDTNVSKHVVTSDQAAITLNLTNLTLTDTFAKEVAIIFKTFSSGSPTLNFTATSLNPTVLKINYPGGTAPTFDTNSRYRIVIFIDSAISTTPDPDELHIDVIVSDAFSVPA